MFAQQKYQGQCQVKQIAHQEKRNGHDAILGFSDTNLFGFGYLWNPSRMQMNKIARNSDWVHQALSPSEVDRHPVQNPSSLRVCYNSANVLIG